MKRRHIFINNLDCKRFKLGKCPYCNNNIYISDMNNLLKSKPIKLTCNHYGHINCIERFLLKNTDCCKCTRKKKTVSNLNQQFKNLNISINFYAN